VARDLALDIRRLLASGAQFDGRPLEPRDVAVIAYRHHDLATAREALHAIKYRGETRLADPLGAAIARRWQRVGVGATLVVHVPVHETRARRRGYDQAELIARAAARRLGLEHVDALVRTRATTAQFDLDRRHRAANVAGAFMTRPERAGRIQGQWVLLVDDVVTTGASLAAAARALETAGAVGVSGITVARER